MLRITVELETGERTQMQIEGWLTGTAIDLLRDEVERKLREGREVVLHLQGIRSIGPEGVRLLRAWESAERVRLRGAGTYLQLLLDSSPEEDEPGTSDAAAGF